MTIPHEALLREVHERHEALTDTGRQDAVERQHRRGKQTARERIAMLSGGSEFFEFGGLAGPGPVQTGGEPLVAPGDGVVTGIAYVDGRPVAIAAFDFTVLGGSNGTVGMAKVERCAERALKDRIPLILLCDGGGHRRGSTHGSRHPARHCSRAWSISPGWCRRSR